MNALQPIDVAQDDEAAELEHNLQRLNDEVYSLTCREGDDRERVANTRLEYERWRREHVSPGCVPNAKQAEALSELMDCCSGAWTAWAESTVRLAQAIAERDSWKRWSQS